MPTQNNNFIHFVLKDCILYILRNELGKNNLYNTINIILYTYILSNNKVNN